MKRIGNQQVVGSNPTAGSSSRTREIARAVGRDFVGPLRGENIELPGEANRHIFDPIRCVGREVGESNRT